MKNLLLFCALAVLLSCKKDKTPNNDQLIGKWEYRGVSCECPPPNPASIAPGNGNIIIFAATTYKQFKNDTLIKSGTYRTRKFDENREQIVYDNMTSGSEPSYFRINNNILTFYGPLVAVDEPEFHYERLSNGQ
jgi:hypothetical protein